MNRRASPTLNFAGIVALPDAMLRPRTAQPRVSLPPWRKMALDPDFYPPHPNQTMACPEYIRLQQLYEVAIRRWAQVQASLSEEVRQRVLAERNAAKNRLVFHQQNCNKCRKPGH
jgi:hypothetical protein